MILSSSDTKRTLMHLFLFTNYAKRELVSMYAEYTRPQLTFLALVPWVNVEVHITIIFNFFSYALDLLRLILTE